MPSIAGNPRVALTAYATAGAWAHYGFPQAQLFDSRRGRALFWPLHYGCRALRPIVPAAGWFSRYLYWRHRWFDSWLQQTAPALAIEIGAGLSARGLNYADGHANCEYVDYDLPAMAKAKQARLAGLALPANFALRAGDLLDATLGHELNAPGAGRVVVLTEGLIDYLDGHGKRRAWRHIAALLKRLGGGRYLFEIYPRDRLEVFGAAAPIMLTALARLTGHDMTRHLLADSSQALDMLEHCGFRRAAVVAPPTLDDPDDQPPAAYRPFELIEAEI